MKTELQKALHSFIPSPKLQVSENEALEFFLEKALADPTQGGRLIPVHIIDVNGHHTVRYHTREEASTIGPYYHHKVVQPLIPGHRFTHNKNGSGEITKIKGHDGKGYEVVLKYDSGKKGTAYVHNIELHPPETVDHGHGIINQTGDTVDVNLLGTTDSGKDVYTNRAATSYKNFTWQDHIQAARLYMNKKYGDGEIKWNQAYHDRQLEHEAIGDPSLGMYTYDRLNKEEKWLVNELADEYDSSGRTEKYDQNPYRDYIDKNIGFAPGFLEEGGFGNNEEDPTYFVDNKRYFRALASFSNKMWKRMEEDPDYKEQEEEEEEPEIKTSNQPTQGFEEAISELEALPKLDKIKEERLSDLRISLSLAKEASDLEKLDPKLEELLARVGANQKMRQLYSELDFSYSIARYTTDMKKAAVGGLFESVVARVIRFSNKKVNGSLKNSIELPYKSKISVTPSGKEFHEGFTTVHELGHYVHYKYAYDNYKDSSSIEREEFADSFVKLVSPSFKIEWRSAERYGGNKGSGITTHETKATYQLAKKIVEDNSLNQPDEF